MKHRCATTVPQRRRCARARCGQMGLTELVAALVLCLFYAKTVDEPRRLDAQLHSIRGALAALDAEHHTEAELQRLPPPTTPTSARPAAAAGTAALAAAAGVSPPPTPASDASRHVRLKFASAGTHLYIGVPLEHASKDEGVCWGSAAPGALDPRTVFVVRPFPGRSADSTDVALLSLSSNKLLEVGVPGAASTGPKWVLRASIDPALNRAFAPRSARFALRGERLRSVATESFLNNVGGFVRFHSAIDPKDRPSAESEATTRLVVEDVDAAALEPYLALKERSDARIAAAMAHGAALRAAAAADDAASGGASAAPTRIALGVAMTSKGTQMRGVADSPFFNVLLPSFLATAASRCCASRSSFSFRCSCRFALVTVTPTLKASFSCSLELSFCRRALLPAEEPEPFESVRSSRFSCFGRGVDFRCAKFFCHETGLPCREILTVKWHVTKAT